jgi:hypothetical protein
MSLQITENVTTNYYVPGLIYVPAKLTFLLIDD